jgi:phosphoglycerol transferase MdoB-like AlkP superfamily enzyme
MRYKYQYIIGFIVLLGVIFGLRLMTNDNQFIYTLSSWLLGLGSLGLLGSLYVLYGKELWAFLLKSKDIWLILVSLILMELLFVIKNVDHLYLTYFFGLIISLLIWIIIYVSIPKTYAKIFAVITMIIFGSYVIGQDIYVRIFHDYFSFKEALTLREGVESGQSMYRFNWLHPVIASLMISTVWIYLKSKIVTHVTWNRQIARRMTTSFLMVFLLTMMNARIPQSNQTDLVSDHYLYQTVYSRQKFAETFGFFHLMGRDLLDSFTPRWHSQSDVLAINQYFENNPKAYSTHDQVGLFENKNLVFILAESYDESILDETLTPNLYRLKTEGISFSNHYTPVFQRTTSDSEFIFNTSLIPSIEDGPTVTVFKQNSYNQSLARLFRNKGYLTQAFHGNYKEFYGRHVIYENYGYDAFYGQNELGLTPETGRFDEIFFESAKDQILSTETKFMSFIITFAGHSPYTEEHDVANTHIDFVNSIYPNDDPSLNYYRATQVELDHMIGRLFSSLEEKEIFDDTVIVLSGDHYPYTMPQETYEAFTGMTENHLKQRGNLYVWSSDVTPRTINTLTTSFDILPTLNALFDLGGDPTPYVGYDAFITADRYVLYKDYSYYDGIHHRFLEHPNETTDQARKIAYMYQIYKKILRTNYFK